MIWLVGLGPFLLVQLPITLLAASIGVWLFYVQHQFEDTFWEHDEDWTFQEAALHGSSHYVLPPVLRWFSANIGVHHVHHLSSRIPYYRLAAGAARSSAACRGRAADAAAELPLRPHGAVGRGAAATCFIRARSPERRVAVTRAASRAGLAARHVVS